MMGDNHAKRFARDDEPTVMSMDERAVWVQVFVTVATSAGYFATVVPRVVDGPVEEVSWVAPMLWAVGISITGMILGSILAGIGGAIGLEIRGRDAKTELASDRRDKDIERHARLRTYALTSLTVAGGIVLSMLHLDTLWIGNFLYLMATITMLAESGIRIRAYRRGFTR